MTGQEMLDGIYEVQYTVDIEDILCSMFKQTDDWMQLGYFHKCNYVLANIDMSRLDPNKAEDILVGFACSQFRISQLLPDYLSFIDRAQIYLATIIGDEEARDLMSEFRINHLKKV